MKWTDKYKQLNSSSFHEEFRQFLLTDPTFKNLKAFQEVPVNDLIPSYTYQHYIDWYIESFGLAIELHGIQHYKPIGFGNISMHDKLSNLASTKKRDLLKKNALIDANYKYLEIPFHKRNFRELILGAL